MYKLKNEESFGELLIVFFWYYFVFQWVEIIFVCMGNMEFIKMYFKVWWGFKIRIEDFMDGGNVIRVVFDEYEVRCIKQFFKIVLNNLNRNLFLESIF